jgi:hypothetical protein
LYSAHGNAQGPDLPGYFFSDRLSCAYPYSWRTWGSFGVSPSEHDCSNSVLSYRKAWVDWRLDIKFQIKMLDAQGHVNDRIALAGNVWLTGSSQPTHKLFPYVGER